MPSEDEIKNIFGRSIQTLKDQNLDFEVKQTIIRNTVGKIIGTQKQLQVFGKIPLQTL